MGALPTLRDRRLGHTGPDSRGDVAIAQGAASLPGQWSAISQCSSNGVTYAGLIAPGTERVSILIGRDIEGLYVARAGGEVVARGCASVTDALTAVRWSLRQV